MIRLRQSSEPPGPPWQLDVRGSVVQWIHPAPPRPTSQRPTRAAPRPAPPVGGSAGTGPAKKYQLQMALELGNPNEFSISLDTIVIQFQPLDGHWSIDDVVEQRTTFTANRRMTTRFTYRTPAPPRSPDEDAEADEDEPRVLTVAGRRGIELPRVPLGGIYTHDHRPARLRALFLHAGSEIVIPVTSQLPPRSAIPEIPAPFARHEGIPLAFARKAEA